MNRAIALAPMLSPCVDRVFPSLNAVAAFSYMESADHFGKIVVLMGGLG